MIKLFAFLLSHSRKMPGQYLKSGHGIFLPRPIKLSIAGVRKKVFDLTQKKLCRLADSRLLCAIIWYDKQPQATDSALQLFVLPTCFQLQQQGHKTDNAILKKTDELLSA